MKIATMPTEKSPLTRVIQTVLYGVVLTSSIALVTAGGFEGANKGDVDLEDYECEDCLVPEDKEFTLKFSLGYLDNEAVRFQRYSGIEDGANVFLSGQSIIRDEEGLMWKTDFHNLGIDSGGFHSELGVQGSYNIALDYQNIPLTYQSYLRSPFVRSGNNLNLNPAYTVSDSSASAINSAGFNQLDLATDWQTIGLSFDWHSDSNLNYELDYRQLSKEGNREFSVGQMLTAAYIPLPIDNETEDMTATVSWFDDSFYAALSAMVSRFDNQLSSVIVEYPLTSIVSGSESVEIAQEPSNTYQRVNLNLRYRYTDRSHLKFNYSRGVLEQNEPLLAYSLNPIFQSALPVDTFDAEVVSKNMNFQLLHSFTKQWRVKLDYRQRDRDNNSPIYNWDRLITDLYVAGTVSNLPYDYSSKTFTATMTLLPSPNHRINMEFKDHEKDRTLQQVTNNSESGYEFQYVGRFGDLGLLLASEQFNRLSSQKTLIDYLEVSENPLLSRFNVAQRDQAKQRIVASYPISETLSMNLTYVNSTQDYLRSFIGLRENNQQDYAMDVNWIFDETTQLAFYYQQQKIDTWMAGSSSFSTPDWLADTQDEIQSYGADLRFNELFDQTMTLTISMNQSDATSDVTVQRVGTSNDLPQINYDWYQAEIALTYPWSQSLDIELKYHYQDFTSADYAIDQSLPGNVVQLLTLGDLSDEYQVNYIQLSGIYRF